MRYDFVICCYDENDDVSDGCILCFYGSECCMIRSVKESDSRYSGRGVDLGEKGRKGYRECIDMLCDIVSFRGSNRCMMKRV